MHTGVLSATQPSKALRKISGNFTPKMKRGTAINAPIIAGFKKIFLTLTYFLSPEIMREPKVKAIVFMAIEKTAE